MADIKNIDVFQTVTSVSFEVEPNTDIININKVTTSGYGGIPNLQEVTDEGSATTNPITANSFIKSGGTGTNVLLDNGTTTPLTSIVGTTNLTTSQTSTNFTINSNTGTDASVPLGNGTLAGATLNDYTTVEKSKLAGIETGAEVNINADWNATSGDAQILNKPTIPSISGLATVTYVDAQDALKVDKIVGKGLSTEDYTTTEKNKLAGIAIGAEVNVNADWNATSGDAQILNKPTIPSIAGLATTTYVDNKDNSQQLQLNYLDRDNSIFDAFYLRTIADSGTVEAPNQLLSSLAVLRNISYVNQGYTQQINADKFVKLGGAADEFLMADGSISYGGGGGGATNLTTTQTSTNFTINSNTGTDATVPLGNGTLAGATLNDFTSAEKTKLSGIATGAEVNVNADWNAVSGDAQILNKPTIPTAVTQTSQLTNNGADGVNPFITALDIPTDGQAGTLVREVKNMTGATLLKGTVVYISGANGNKPIVSKALATTDALSSRTFGMLQSDILNNGLGNCVIIGDLTGLNTSTFAEGDQLYLSGVTAGTYTATKTLAPTHLVYVGKVTRSHPTLGQIEVGIQNGYELEEIHDVQIITPLNNEGIFYETSTDLWKNKSIATALGFTPYNATNPSGYQTAGQVQTIADAKVVQTITNGVTATAPSQDAVFDALALKANDSSVVHLTGIETIAGAKTFSSNITIPATGTALILSASSGGTVSGLTTTTYPDLTELSYVKGVTSAIQTQFSGKQATLISGNNIKSINGNSLLGSGDLVVSQTGTIIVTSGTSFTTPSTITTSTVFIIELVGAGGGGGGGPAGTSSSASGAGSGGYVFERITGLSPSTTYTCAIGTGGTGGAAATNGTAGTSTTLTIGAATFTASGGGFGTATQSAAGGAGGTGSATGGGADIVISGQNGGDSLNTAASVPSGTGGSSPKGWGLGGSGVLANKNGYNATGYGAGGSGGKGVAASGGNGTQGIIYCQYFN
jgi:hypothetical protein